MLIRTLASLLIAASLSACTSSQILRDRDYQASTAAFKTGKPEEAQKLFPKKEQGGFITSIERAWISLWQETPESQASLEDHIAELEKQSRTFDDRRFVSISREAAIFLTQESEEGYMPAEHEVVVLHLVAAMKYMQNKKWEDAEVEARRASFYLQNPFNQDLTHFDDPGLRLWLAGVWNALGNWDAAQVDLRKAAELSGSSELRRLSEGPRPKELTLTFTGLAPTYSWNNLSPVPNFETTRYKPEKPPTRIASFNSDPWFSRHRERNTILRDVMIKSNYMAGYLGSEALTNTARGVGSVTVASIGVVGVVAGVAIVGGGIYLLAQAGPNMGDAFAYVFGLGALVVTTSYDFAKKSYHQVQQAADEQEQRDLERLRTYRMVRYLPNWISLDLRANSPAPLRHRTLEFERKPDSGKTIFLHEF